MPRESAPAMRAEDDHACFMLLCGLDDPFPGRRGLDRAASRPEPGLLCQCRTAVCGPLRGQLYLGGVLSIEVSIVDRHEADVRRLPHADDECVAIGRELAPGIFDRELREFGAVEGKQNESGHVSPHPG